MDIFSERGNATASSLHADHNRKPIDYANSIGLSTEKER